MGLMAALVGVLTPICAKHPTLTSRFLGIQVALTRADTGYSRMTAISRHGDVFPLMIKLSRSILAPTLSLLLAISPLFDVRSLSAAEPAQQSPWTQEKVKPKEVQDKEKSNDSPVAWCTKTKKNGDNETSATYADGTEVKHIPGKSWVIIIPGPNGKTKITYDETNRTKIVEQPGKQPAVQDPAKDPAAKQWKDDLEKESKKSSFCIECGLPSAKRLATAASSDWRSWLFSTPPLAKVISQQFSSSENARAVGRDSSVRLPVSLAAAAELAVSNTPDSTTAVGGVINTKLVTFGGPLPGVTVHFEPDPDPNTPKPDDFVRNEKPQNSWNEDDKPGPTLIPGPGSDGFIPIFFPGPGGRPGPGGTPGPGGSPWIPGPGGGPTPGGWINIGGGWSHVRIPVGFFTGCSSDADDGPNESPRSAQAPTPATPVRRTIEQQQADEWDKGITRRPDWDGDYNPTGEGNYIKGVREDAANIRATIAKLTEERHDSCAPDWFWDWKEGNPIWKQETYLMRRQWMIEIYEAAYERGRLQGLDNLAAHAYAQIKLDEWRQEAVDQFVNTMIEHLQNFQGAINGMQAMRAAAEYAEEFLRAKDLLRRREIMEKAIKQAKAAQAAPKVAGKNPKLNEGGVHQALAPEGNAPGGPQRTSARPQAPKQQASCPRPTDPKKAAELKQLEEKIDAKAKRTDEIAAKLTKNRMGEDDPDWFKENPGDQLSRPQREALEKEFDKLMGENIKDLSKAIHMRNELYPKAAAGKSSITPAEAQALLSGNKPLMGSDKMATPQSESPTQRFGPGSTQKLP
jgi:hypothetical protein